MQKDPFTLSFLSSFYYFFKFYFIFWSIDLQRPCLFLFHLVFPESFLTPPLTETKQLIIKTQYFAKCHILCHKAEHMTHTTLHRLLFLAVSFSSSSTPSLYVGLIVSLCHQESIPVSFCQLMQCMLHKSEPAKTHHQPNSSMG